MIERSDPIKIFNEILGAKGARGRLVRVAPEGFYEVTLESGGRNYHAMLPIEATVVLAVDPIEEVPTVDVER